MRKIEELEDCLAEIAEDTLESPPVEPAPLEPETGDTGESETEEEVEQEPQEVSEPDTNIFDELIKGIEEQTKLIDNDDQPEEPLPSRPPKPVLELQGELPQPPYQFPPEGTRPVHRYYCEECYLSNLNDIIPIKNVPAHRESGRQVKCVKCGESIHVAVLVPENIWPSL